jgi:HlyD family secretion protein
MPRFPPRDRNRLRDAGRTQRVWVLRDGVPAEIVITTGVSDGTFTEVTDGALEPGTEVIVDTQQPPS